jgi:predicted metal-dependent hydrolase
MVTEPEPPDPHWPRYSTGPFPSYRFVPGRTPHPRRDPRGHSYGLPEPKATPFSADQWQTSGDYLYGIDLYNFAYWWESHEVFEGLWHAVGHHSVQGNFLQALIQLSAANLKYFVGNPAAGCNLIRSGIIRLRNAPPSYLGVDVLTLIEAFQAHMINPRPPAPLILLS